MLAPGQKFKDMVAFSTGKRALYVSVLAVSVPSWSYVSMTVSGLSDMDSMPSRSSHSARSG